ncbi:unnamed protein product, partial [Iphiclides podalirius]
MGSHYFEYGTRSERIDSRVVLTLRGGEIRKFPPSMAQLCRDEFPQAAIVDGRPLIPWIVERDHASDWQLGLGVTARPQLNGPIIKTSAVDKEPFLVRAVRFLINWFVLARRDGTRRTIVG